MHQQFDDLQQLFMEGSQFKGPIGELPSESNFRLVEANLNRRHIGPGVYAIASQRPRRQALSGLLGHWLELLKCPATESTAHVDLILLSG